MRNEHCGWKEIYRQMGVDPDFSGSDEEPGEWDYLDLVDLVGPPPPARAILSRAIHLQEAPVEVEG